MTELVRYQQWCEQAPHLIYSKTKEKSALCLQYNVPLVRECCYTYEGIPFRQFGGCNRTLGYVKLSAVHYF